MKRITGIFFLCCMVSAPAYAVDGIAFAGGSGSDADLATVSLTWNWDKRWFTEGDWSLGGYWELSGTAWKGDGPRPEKELYGIGIAPVFRFQRNAFANSISPYAEVGVGAYQFSGKQIHGEQSMGSRFEFGTHIGLGMTFGDRQQFDVSYRIQHFSNAGITSTNPGINFNEIRIGYHF